MNRDSKTGRPVLSYTRFTVLYNIGTFITTLRQYTYTQSGKKDPEVRFASKVLSNLDSRTKRLSALSVIDTKGGRLRCLIEGETFMLDDSLVGLFHEVPRWEWGTTVLPATTNLKLSFFTSNKFSP